MNRNLFCFAFLLYSCLSFSVFSQGCSDAGFCTMGAMKPDQKFHKQHSVKLRALEVNHYLGLTRFDDVIRAFNLDFNVAIGDKNQLQFKIPYQMVDGPLANTSGLGDISLSYTRNLITKEGYQLNATIGTKIPTGKPTKLDFKGRPLPMYYQTTLGTYDFIAGISFITRKWLIATGYQQALNGVDNQFLWGAYDPNGANAANNTDISQEFFDTVIKGYPVARNLYRGKDLMLRVERNFRFSKFNVNLGMLYIYRIDKDEIEKGDEILLTDNSNGLAWTGLAGFGYRISPQLGIKVMNGFRIIKRDFNPDGLSREFVNTIGLELRF